MATTMKLIAKNVLGSDTATVTFSSIPGTYTDLYIVISARSSSGDLTVGQADFLYMNLNSTNQSSHRYLYGTGSGTGSATSPTRGLGFLTDPACTSNTFASIEIYIPNYAGTTAKSVSAISMTENNATAATMAAHAALFSSVTSAVTSIDFTTEDAASFKSGSSFFLYGISKA
jgi:hypothetical protein